MRRLASLLFVLACTTAHPARITSVAVMPFKDLSGTDRPVGDAIRESVTSDLRGAPGIRVVERSEIDRVILEQKLQAEELEKDPLATVRLGKLLGADLMTLGAYQQVGKKIRLTARFVKVETGEVVGTAKVDGHVSEFLKLQDHVTIELLKSSRLAPQVVERLARRARPKLRSIRPVQLYGRASTERDEKMKAALLKEVVKEAPEFSYATDELTRLEQRLRALEEKRAAEQRAELEGLRKAYAAAGTPQERWIAALQLAGGLMSRQRWHEARDLYRELRREQKDDANVALAWAMEFNALLLLGRSQEVLEQGEQFLAQYPGSPQFGVVKSALERVIELRRRVEAGKSAAAKKAAELRSEARWDLCKVGWIYLGEAQYPEARRLFMGCLAAGTGSKVEALKALVEASIQLGEWKSAREWLTALEAESPSEYQRTGAAARMPTDG